MSVRSRIAAALAANAFGQAVTVASQILLTPLYFRYWGAALYGEWLILSSIPAYLTMADLGIGSAAGNEMTMRAGAGDRTGAQRTMLGALWVSAGAAALVMALGLAAAALALHWRVPHTPSLAPAEAALVLAGLALTVALGFPGGVVSAGFRCGERNAQGILWANGARLAEMLSVGGLLLARQPPAVICWGMVVVKAVALVAQWLVLWRVCPWLFAPAVRADRRIVRRLIAPALGFMAFPLGNALALQGPILIIGAVFGGPAVAMFSALRTLARVPMQLTNMINASVWPEMSRAFGAQDMGLLRRLHQGAWGTTVMIIATFGIGLVICGSWITSLWLGAAAPFDGGVFAALVLLTILSATWGASAVVLTAINAHARVGLAYVIVNGAFMGLAALLASPWRWAGLLVPLLIAEAALLVWVLGQVMRKTGDGYGPFLVNAIRLPLRRLGAGLRRTPRVP
ncbi:conserved membrane hypothetical protein [Rubrivivax sp. A210]|uniref:lipopolysaccharide biosynthesis protein n=1 Tax=Rubrivivax sp. A210 TaxID=2772301 RepID=UPI00191A162B|nr:oligosaccharide flippase family protein [Rubrivivax sp. A210]CAD5369164.1 conserved membrane hypothetical protein [Rubrivivax sp. A210]